MCAPQPEVFTTTRSTPAASKASMVRCREGERGRVLARVGVERAAAGLRARRQHLDAVPREHARGGAVLRAEGHLLDAAGEQPDAWRARAPSAA